MVSLSPFVTDESETGPAGSTLQFARRTSWQAGASWRRSGKRWCFSVSDCSDDGLGSSVEEVSNATIFHARGCGDRGGAFGGWLWQRQRRWHAHADQVFGQQCRVHASGVQSPNATGHGLLVGQRREHGVLE